jgi:transcriptional regulator with XRE-family HTH domain
VINAADFYDEVGRRISRARKGRLTQAQLAERVALTRTSITNIEKGRQRIMLHTLAQIADALGVPTSELLPQAGVDVGQRLSDALKSRSKEERDWIKSSVTTARKGELK